MCHKRHRRHRPASAHPLSRLPVLLELRLQNFRSFRDEAVLSFVADRSTDHEATHLLAGPDGHRVLRTALIYGANASGKSNVLNALWALSNMVGRDSLSLDAAFLEPFRFDRDSRDSPTHVGVTLSFEHVRFEYDVTVREGVVHSERLSHYPARRERLLFSRTGQEVQYGPDLRSSRTETIAELLPPLTGTLLLNLLRRFEVAPVADVARWLGSFRIPDARFMSQGHTIKAAVENPAARSFLRDLLRNADTGITDFDIRLRDDALSAGDRPTTAGHYAEAFKTVFSHSTDPELGWLESYSESTGTQAMFVLAGPLFDALQNGSVLMLDDLGGELHPDLVRKLIELFNTPSVNRNGAQLLAATHETSVLDQRYVRRDSVWFTEKGRDGASRLYPLTDYKPRREESLRKGYLDGRYGALPVLPRFLFPAPEPAETPASADEDAPAPAPDAPVGDAA